MDFCLCEVVVLVVDGVVLVGVVGELDEELELLLPQAASAKLLASTANSVSIAVSDVRFMGRAPIVLRGLESPPYQGPGPPIAVLERELSVRAAAEPQPVPVPGEPSETGSGSNWLLIVCCVAQFMVILDLSIVNVALPDIQSSLEFSSPALQWVVDAYAIAFAGFLMLGGRAADHFGQRRTFVAALILFGIASLAGGAAPSRDILVAARGLQGFAGALMAASSLAIITSSFEPGPALNRAIGIWAAMNGLGGSAGVLLGGILTEISWRWVLLINPPIALVAAVVAHRVVAERRRTQGDASFDLAGALTLTVGQMILVFGVVEAGLKGWGTFAALGPIALGIVLLIVFGLIETRIATNPLIPFKELTRPLQNANRIVLLFSAALFPMWVLSSLYLQQVLGLSPIHTGLIFLPMTIVIAIVAKQSGKLVGQFGVRAVLGSGLLMLTVGLLLFTRINSSGSGIVYVVIPGILTAAGIAMSIVPSTIAATQGAKPGQTGLASGLVNTSRQVGGGLGLAVLITLATQRSTHLIGTGQQVAQALTNGFRLAYLIGAALAGAAALLTFLTVPRPEGARRGAARSLSLAIGLVLVLFVGLTAAFSGSKAPPLGQYATGHTYSYVTEPGLHPPVIRKLKSAPAGKLAPGLILMTNFYDLNKPPIVGQSGPLILDGNMQPVWFQPVPEKVLAVNLEPQTYEGRPALSWWQGKVTNTGATESGEDVVVDQHYRVIARLKATGGWVLTLHEFLIEGENAWVTANRNIPLDLSRYGGAYNGALVDAAVQEYNLRTGRLIRSWDALKHISLSQSEATLPTNGFPWDAYHINSVDISRRGKFLVSMRNTWAAYLVDAASGRIEWTLGGRGSNFKFGPGARFEWQHDVRLQGTSQVSMFDDHCCQQKGGGSSVPATGPSRGLILNINERARTATLAAQYGEHEGFESEYMGRTQPLPDGNVFVGWGSSRYFSEYTGSGQLLLEAELPEPDLTYRATLGRWEGSPLTPPVGAARPRGGGTAIYASWNGATQVASWRVLAGTLAGPMTTVASAPRSGFETTIALARSYPSFKLQALDAAGHVLGTSQAFS